MDSLGKKGENSAVLFLKKKGYTILHQNYYTQWGEIDIIGTLGDLLVFFEVKTRTKQKLFGQDYSTILSAKKISHLARSIGIFFEEDSMGETTENWRVDLIIIEVLSHKAQITHIPGVFDESFL